MIVKTEQKTKKKKKNKTQNKQTKQASDELVEIGGADAMTSEAAEQTSMGARAHWFADEEAAGTAEASAD